MKVVTSNPSEKHHLYIYSGLLPSQNKDSFYNKKTTNSKIIYLSHAIERVWYRISTRAQDVWVLFAILPLPHYSSI